MKRVSQKAGGPPCSKGREETVQHQRTRATKAACAASPVGQSEEPFFPKAASCCAPKGSARKPQIHSI